MAARAERLDSERLAGFLASLPALSRAVILPLFRSGLERFQKADKSPVTEADRQTEQVLRQAISNAFPEHSILGEEFGGTATDGYCWVLDPIDGTRPFLAGKPSFGSLVGLCLDGQPVAGLIDMPALGESYIGIIDPQGQPLYSQGPDGSALHSSRCDQLARARIATTSPHAFSEAGWQDWLRLSGLCENVLYGGDCSNYALLAAGHIEIVMEDSLASHDIMALVPVLLASGACVSDWAGQPVTLHNHKGQLLCSANQALHEAALARLSAS